MFFYLFPLQKGPSLFFLVGISWFYPFSLDKGCVYSLVLVILKRSSSCPTTYTISCIKIPPILHKRSAAFHCCLSAKFCFLPVLGLSTYSKFLPFSNFSLIKKSFSSILCLLVTSLHGMDNQVYHYYLESVNRCLYQPALFGVDLYGYRQLNLSLFEHISF